MGVALQQKQMFIDALRYKEYKAQLCMSVIVSCMELMKSNNEKDLGLLIDGHLDFSDHIYKPYI